MLPNLMPDVELAEKLFAELRARSFDGVGITREAYGPGERMAHALVREAAAAIGLESKADPVGNLFLTLPGSDRAAKRVHPRQPSGQRAAGRQLRWRGRGAGGSRRRCRDEAGRLHPGAGHHRHRDPRRGSQRLVPHHCSGSRGALGSCKPEDIGGEAHGQRRDAGDDMRDEGFDPARLVVFGLGANLNRPDANITGLPLHGLARAQTTGAAARAGAKGQDDRHARGPHNPASAADEANVQTAAHALGQQIKVLHVTTGLDIDIAFALLAREHPMPPSSVLVRFSSTSATQSSHWRPVMQCRRFTRIVRLPKPVA